MLTALFYDHKIALANQSILYFYIHFGIVFFYSCEKYYWDFDRDYTKTRDGFG